MEKTRNKITFHIISHTHWDREWYLPFEVFRIELVELINNLLAILEQNKDFIFHLDGQSIILQDYLEIKPHKREQIKKFVKSGNLLIGPWYVLSDQFLTSGEALIRNLLYGIRDSREFGVVMLTGYCPDQFGQIAQLPQVFKGFNINSAIVGRGIQDSMSEHMWYGLNGDSIVAVALTHWYNNAQRFPDGSEKLHKYLEKIYATQAKTSLSGHILLMNGCDHLFPQNNLSDVLKSASSNQKWQLKHDSLPKALSNILKTNHKEDYPVYFGELRDDNNKYILAGTLSSRVYLKLENYKCQTNLEKIIEPLSVLVDVIARKDKVLTKQSHKSNMQSEIASVAEFTPSEAWGLPRNDSQSPYPFLKYAWKLLIQNHAHDSICGCSIDDVHKEMEIRFLKVEQVLDKIQERLLSDLNDRGRDVASQRLYLQLINLSAYHRNDIIQADLEFPLGPPGEHPSASPTINKEEIKDLLLKDKDKKIDLEILDSSKTFKMIRSKDEVPLLQAIQKIKILFQTDVEPFSVCSYEIDAAIRRYGDTAKEQIKSELRYINDFYKLNINKDGTLTIALNNEKTKFENIHYLIIEDDLGDEYNFVPAQNSKIIDSKSWKWDIQIIEENSFRKKFLFSTSHISELDIKTEITCYKNTSRIDFKTKVINRFKNKRIRLHFPTELNIGYLSADTPFGIIQRSRPPIDWTNHANSQPLHNWLDHTSHHTGLAFFGGGLADYELYEDGSGFALTLIRAIGKLSTVKSHSLIETPDAQCNRELEFSYAVYPHLGNTESDNISKEQLIYQNKLLANQSNLKLTIPSLIKAPDELVISSLKRAESDENMYILRLFNPFNKNINNCNLTLNFNHKGLFLLNLDEEKMQTLSSSGGQLTFNIGPYEIITFGIQM